MVKFLIISLIIVLLVAACLANASELEVNVNELIQGQIKYAYKNENIFKISSEIYNSGSVGYKARSRIDIFDKDNIIFTGWSREKPLVPGEQKDFNIYWCQPNTSGNFIVRLRFYYGGEMYEKNITFEISTQIQEDIFEIYNFRTYDDYIRFDIKSKKNS